MGLAELWAIREIEADPLCQLDTRVAKYTVRALAMMYKHKLNTRGVTPIAAKDVVDLVNC